MSRQLPIFKDILIRIVVYYRFKSSKIFTLHLKFEIMMLNLIIAAYSFQKTDRAFSIKNLTTIK